MNTAQVCFEVPGRSVWMSSIHCTLQPHQYIKFIHSPIIILTLVRVKVAASQLIPAHVGWRGRLSIHTLHVQCTSYLRMHVFQLKGKPGCPIRSHTGTGRTCKLYAKRLATVRQARFPLQPSYKSKNVIVSNRDTQEFNPRHQNVWFHVHDWLMRWCRCRCW